MPENPTDIGAPEDQAPEQDLRSIIEAAVEEQKSDAPDSETPREPKAKSERLAQPREGREPQGERARDPATGRFIEGQQQEQHEQRQARPGAPQQAPQQAPQGPPQPERPRPQDGAGLRPPDGWAPAVKAQWTRLPMPVREAIANRESQLLVAENRAQAFAGVERYAEAARQSGTSLEKALEAYTGIESLFRRDPAAGLIELMRNTPIPAATILREVVRRLSPAAGSAQPPDNGGMAAQAGIHPEVQQFMHEQRAWQAHQAQQQELAVRGQVDTHVRDFWTDPRHPYAENVAPLMANLINQAHAQGQPTPPLEQVYETACWMNPEVRTLLIEEGRQTGNGRAREVAQRARAAAKAITGAPANGAEYRGAPPENASLREQIQWAIDSQR